MKRTYIQPLSHVVWYWSDEKLAQINGGGMDTTSDPSNPNLPGENFVKEELDWEEDEIVPEVLPTPKSLWDTVW